MEFVKKLKFKFKLLRKDYLYALSRNRDFLIRSLLHNEKNYNNFDIDLAIVAIVKNEAPYIKEWIDFHKLVGVGRFYIYDNCSSDNLYNVLKEYIDAGDVVYKYIEGNVMQIPVYEMAINDYKYDVKYMAFIDADEFIVPNSKNTIMEVIQEIEKEYNTVVDAIAINWKMFGYNNNYKKKDGLVIENYTKCVYPNKHVKSIINPRLFYATKTDPHHFVPLIGKHTINDNAEKMYGPFNEHPTYKKIQINHYWTKSYEELVAKIKRGRSDTIQSYELPKYQGDYLSEIFDDSILRFLPALNGKK